MNVEQIFIPGSEVLIASILTNVPGQNEKVKTEFVTKESHSIQVGVLHRQSGTIVEAHQHLPVQKTVSGCQEVLIVKSGCIHVDIYDQDKTFLATRVLRTGDIYIQYHGGHAFHFMTDVQFIEIKQGPYTPADKVFFDARCHEQVR